MPVKIYHSIVNQLTMFNGYVKGHLKRKLYPFYIRAANLFFAKRSYHAWIQANEPNTADLEAQRTCIFDNMPLFAVVCVFNPSQSIIASLRRQTYVRWHLYILSDSPPLQAEENITFIDISLPSNEIIAQIDGDFIVMLGLNTVLCPFALYEITASININLNGPNGKFFYSDEDSLIGGKRASPYFKPDYSPDTLRSFNYIGTLLVIARELFVQEFTHMPDNIYAVALKCTHNAKGAIVHIPKVLYHTTDNDTRHAAEAISAHLVELGVSVEVEQRSPGLFNVIYEIKGSPRVSVIIPNRDNSVLLAKCVKSVQTADYENYEIVIAENGSTKKDTFVLYDTLKQDKRIRIIHWQGTFNYAKVNNDAVRDSDGAILLFLNNDIEAINPDWIVNMLRHAVRKDVGAVGAKLYYPDGTIQHAGVAVGVGGIAVEYYKGLKTNSTGCFNRLSAVHNVAAVTGACLMLKRELFDRIDGFDESYALAYNDVDLCLRLLELGFPTVWTPYSELIHRESRTRGYEITQTQRQRLEEESAMFTQRWRHILDEGDPYYNPNLSRKRGDFTLS
ncbi:glycosyltransferase family 2 protein [Candidatus Magnetominusculus xianensis]|uniref:Glycosyl transferase n=1 Tax=Candidatus Magnetominusculus xianensis TaxID=1748249 RepID=A0ABR5SJZ0_9BACT|nr:glycosyltransferase family 2 protein [Candidatus Magnetominusculus xianensis]KWT92848.1 glycosyl transferase [Candidatus Magnetominusculus xianensis]MBF0403437.1 glycosyltransferase family 2 protein [Nitrospirota bacterium]